MGIGPGRRLAGYYAESDQEFGAVIQSKLGGKAIALKRVKKFLFAGLLSAAEGFIKSFCYTKRSLVCCETGEAKAR